MKYTYPVEEYLKQYVEYLKMEQISFAKDESKEAILNKLESNAKRKIVMAKISNTMINEYIKPFENNIDDMTEEDANALQSFMDSFDVQLEIDKSGAVDYSIILLISRILIKYYRKTGNFNKYITAVRRNNVGYTIAYLNHGYIPDGEHPNYEYMMDIAAHIDDNNGELVPVVLPVIINALYRSPKTYPLDFYIKTRDYIYNYADKTGAPDLFRFYYLLRALEYFREYVINLKKDKKEVDVEPYKPFLKDLCNKGRDMLDSANLEENDIVSLRQNLAFTRFLIGEINAKDALSEIDSATEFGLTIEDKRLAFSRLTFCNHLYLTFLYWFSGYSEEEIKRIGKKKIIEVLPKITSNDKSANDHFMSYYTLSFVEAALLISPFEDFKDIILEATIFTDKALLIHTMMVKEMSGVIFDYLIEHNPSFFEGVCNKDVDYIVKHKAEMKELLAECCLYHDVGKFFMIDIVENSMRRLTDDEFEVIKIHPRLFDDVYLVKDDESEEIKCIRDIAHTHHLWSDGTRGYPKEFKHTHNKPFTDIVAVVDSLDAATDYLGRPYNAGKKFDQLISEFLERSGTQYGKEVCDALLDKKVNERLRYWTTEGRKDIYYKVYTYQVTK